MKAFVVCRDRVTYAQQCIDALLSVGLEVVIVDHGSTWSPMRRWLEAYARLSVTYDEPRVTVRLDENRHPRDLWAPGGAIERHVQPDERFIVTDCDVIPDPACPANWIDRLSTVLDMFPAIRKAGLGLRTDDIPAHHTHRDMVRSWEAQYQAVGDGGRLNPMNADPGAVIADIDTTLAMYRRFEPFTLGPAVRLRAPYVARHLPWYEDTANLDDEQRYYRAHAVHGHWRDPAGYADDYKLRETQ